MTSSRTAVVMYHVGAGHGGGARFATAARARLTSGGWTVPDPIRTEYAGHAEQELAPCWGAKVERIVVVGGDGTLREVCAGLGDRTVDTDIALVPTGNANVIAREAGIPLDPCLAVDVVAGDTVRALDLGVVHGVRVDGAPGSFLAMVEVGYGARVVRTVAGIRGGPFGFLYRLWGDMVYAVAGTVELFRSGDPRLDVEVDGINRGDEPVAVVVANAATYAKGWSLTPDARIDDGALNCAARTSNSPRAVLRQIAGARRRRTAADGSVAYVRGGRIVVRANAPFRVQVDGDPAGVSSRVEVSVIPGKISLVVPDRG